MRETLYPPRERMTYVIERRGRGEAARHHRLDDGKQVLAAMFKLVSEKALALLASLAVGYILKHDHKTDDFVTRSQRG